MGFMNCKHENICCYDVCSSDCPDYEAYDKTIKDKQIEDLAGEITKVIANAKMLDNGDADGAELQASLFQFKRWKWLLDHLNDL